MPFVKGKLEFDGKIAYVEQEPIIFSGPIKDLITFGCPYDEEKFQKIIQATELTKDLEELNNGAETEIGERGINLSGG